MTNACILVRVTSQESIAQKLAVNRPRNKRWFLVLFFCYRFLYIVLSILIVFLYKARQSGGVLNCNLSHRRSVAVLCMLYTIRCNPKHPLCGALPVPYVPVRVTRCTLIAHRYTYAPPRCRTFPAAGSCSTAGLLFASQYPSGTIWLTPYSMVWD